MNYFTRILSSISLFILGEFFFMKRKDPYSITRSFGNIHRKCIFNKKVAYFSRYYAHSNHLNFSKIVSVPYNQVHLIY